MSTNGTAYWQRKIDGIDAQIITAMAGVDGLKHARGEALKGLLEAEQQEAAAQMAASDLAKMAGHKRAAEMTLAERAAFLKEHRKTYGQ